MYRFFFSLRFRLILLVLLAVIPALGLTFYTGLEQRRIAAIQAKEEALRLARLVSSNQSQFVEGARHFLYTLAQLPQVRNCEPALCRSLFANLMRQYPWYLNIGAVEPDGNIFASAVKMTRPVNSADREWFRRAIQARSFSIGDYQIGRITGKRSVNFSHPVLDESGKLKAVVFVALDLAWLNQLSARAELPPGSTLTLIDRNGMVLARYPKPEKWVGKTIPQALLSQAILAKGEGTVEAIGMDGISRLYAFTPFGSTAQAGKIYLSIGFPTSVTFAEVNRILIRNLIFLGFIALLAFLAAWIGGHLLVLQRLNPLVKATERLSAGDLSARTGIVYGKGELSQLASAFDHMASSLEQRESERKQAEEQLSKLFQAVEQSPVTIIITDTNGNIEYVNPKFSQLTGYTFEEVMGKNPRILKSGETPPEEYKLLWETITSGREWRGEFHNKKKNDELYWESASISPIRNSEGIITHFLGVKEDITERKRVEKEMVALQEQLRQSQKMEAIGQLAGGIAHDFNNLLTVISGNCQLSLLELKERDPLRGNIEEIKKASEKAADLTRQLLAFSRRQIMEMKVLDLNELLKNLDKMLRRVIGEDIELVTLLAEDLGRVKADPGQAEQVIMNFAVNARDAMSEGGKLTIETANVDLDDAYARNHVAVTPGRFVMISVSDTGVGMTPKVRDRVFEPFFTTKEKGKGTGLGLSTVYGIVKQSGGNIWVYSEPGKGTTFKIYLPRVDEPLEKLRERVEGKEIPRGMETILIVEDEEEVRKLALRILERQGYKVFEASQGLDAFLIAEGYEDLIHLLVTDVVMPKIGGRELADRIAEICPEIKVLYMSGYTDNAIVHHGVLGEGMEFIQKPFTVEGLARKVREVLDKDLKPVV